MMRRKNGTLNKLVKKGEVARHRRAEAKTAGKRIPFRTFRLKKGIRIEKASKSAR